MNFGHGITIALVFFMSFIGYLAVRSFQQKIDLVADNYYEQEVAFQQQIDKSQNTISLGENPKIITTKEGQLVSFPKLQKAANISGKIIFFRASNDLLDFETPIALNENGAQLLSNDNFETGNYKMKVEWTYENKTFYYEQQVII